MSQKIQKKNIPLDKIVLDAGTQIRTKISEKTIEEYAERLKAGDNFPAVILFFDKKENLFYMGDGFHRYHAHKLIKAKSIKSEVKTGTLRNAILYAVEANTIHGLKRSSADKRRAVLTLLNDDEWGKWSNREVARRCAVSAGMVDQLRKSLPILGSERTFKTKHGTIAEMDVENIGKRPKMKAVVAKIKLTQKTQKLLENYSVSHGVGQDRVIEEALKIYLARKSKKK